MWYSGGKRSKSFYFLKPEKLYKEKQMIITNNQLTEFTRDWETNGKPFNAPKVLYLPNADRIDLNLLAASGVKELYAQRAFSVYGSCDAKKSFDVLYLPSLSGFHAENCRVEKLHIPGNAERTGKNFRVGKVFFTSQFVDLHTAVDFMPVWLFKKATEAKEAFENEVYESGKFDFSTYDPAVEFERFLYDFTFQLICGRDWPEGFFNLYEHSDIDATHLKECVDYAKESVLKAIATAEKEVLQLLQALKEEYHLDGEAAALLKWGFVTTQESSFEERIRIAAQLTTPDGVEVFKREWTPWRLAPCSP